MKTKILFTSVPGGFPPEEIRKLWVGVKIPLADANNPLSDGVSFNPLTMESHQEDSFVVNACDALNALYAKHPDARNYFEEQGLDYGEETRGQPFTMWTFKVKHCELTD